MTHSSATSEYKNAPRVGELSTCDFPAEAPSFRERGIFPPVVSAATRFYRPIKIDEDSFSDHYAKLDDISHDESLWPIGVEAPNYRSIELAKIVLQEFENISCSPDRVVASAEGGVAICFVNGNRYSDIECLNSEIILGVVSDRNARPVVWEIDQGPRGIPQASRWISRFIKLQASVSDVAKWQSSR
jgi:hypothetical protein